MVCFKNPNCCLVSARQTKNNVSSVWRHFENVSSVHISVIINKYLEASVVRPLLVIWMTLFRILSIANCSNFLRMMQISAAVFYSKTVVDCPVVDYQQRFFFNNRGWLFQQRFLTYQPLLILHQQRLIGKKPLLIVYLSTVFLPQSFGLHFKVNGGVLYYWQLSDSHLMDQMTRK